jgi:hypothetical protein
MSDDEKLARVVGSPVPDWQVPDVDAPKEDNR